MDKYMWRSYNKRQVRFIPPCPNKADYYSIIRQRTYTADRCCNPDSSPLPRR